MLISAWFSELLFHVYRTGAFRMFPLYALLAYKVAER
jgi:hypothetical protein